MRPARAVTAIAIGTQANQAHFSPRKPLAPTLFHGLSGLVRSATV